MRPDIVLTVLLLFGGAQIVAGIYILAGLGWAMIALGTWAIAFAVLFARGLRANG